MKNFVRKLSQRVNGKLMGMIVMGLAVIGEQAVTFNCPSFVFEPKVPEELIRARNETK